MAGETTIEDLPDDALRNIFSLVDHAFPIVWTCKRWWILMKPLGPYGSLTFRLCDAAAKGYVNLMDMYRIEGNPDTNEALKAAAGASQLEAMQKLFLWGALKRDGALYMAARKNQPEAIEMLLKSGACEFQGAMMLAAEYGSKEAMERLYVTRGSHKWKSEELTLALREAARHGQVGSLEILIKWETPDEWPPVLSQAAVEGHIDAMEKLVAHGYPGKRAALMRAAAAGQVNAIEWLLDHGALGEVRAMVTAAKNGRKKAVSALYKRGVRALDESLVSAAASGHVGIMSKLRDWGATCFEEALVAHSRVNGPHIRNLLKLWIDERDNGKRQYRVEDFYPRKARRLE